VPCSDTKKLELPPLWEWQSDWTVKDKADSDGWFHASSLDSMCAPVQSNHAYELLTSVQVERREVSASQSVGAGQEVGASNDDSAF
jgi:hypothetical protein